jgi:hypothetical protein
VRYDRGREIALAMKRHSACVVAYVETASVLSVWGMSGVLVIQRLRAQTGSDVIEKQSASHVLVKQAALAMMRRGVTQVYTAMVDSVRHVEPREVSAVQRVTSHAVRVHSGVMTVVSA